MSTFESNIISIYQEKGVVWLAELPKHVLRFESLWGLHDLKPFDNLSFNYVLAGYQNDLPIVLKLSLNTINLAQEAKTLKAFDGFGAVSVLDCTEGALLLQRAVPGLSLKDHSHNIQNSGAGVKITCEVIERLHRAPLPKDSNFPHIGAWLAALDKEWNLPQEYLNRARRLKDQLLQIAATPTLLHGDLHQENILSNGNEWLMIDPKGVIGSPINELWTCVEEPEYDLEYISKYFNFKFDEVVKWSYVHLILAACWQVEDNLDPKHFLSLAEKVLPMMED